MTAEAAEMTQTVVGGLGIFLLGMKLLSDGMQAVAGSKLNKLICAVTDNRLLAIVVGVLVTGIIQSSSATTVMVIGFVNSGLMTLMQAIGVIFGANIGTTMSMWILTLNISKYGALVIGVSAMVYLFAKKDRAHYIGMAVLGLGMLFFGLEMMSEGFKPIRSMDATMRFITQFEATSTSGFIKSVLVGVVATAVIQSSTAVIGIVMSLAANSVIGFETSVALIMGSNIGTTVTAALACIGASRNACRAALAHSLFNIIGVLFVVMIHTNFIYASEKLVRWVSGNPSGPLNLKLAIALVHTTFNVGCTILLLPLMGLFGKVVTWMLPVRKEEAKSERYKPQFLDKRLLNTAPVALEQAKKEILRMGTFCVDMCDDLQRIFAEGRNGAVEEAVFRAEDNLDVAQMEIAEYVSALLHDNVSHEIAVAARREIKQADEFESVSDHVRNALKAYLKIRNAGEELTEVAMSEVKDLCVQVRAYCVQIMDIVKEGSKARVAEATERNKQIDTVAKHYRDCHMQRLAVTCTAPVKSLVYSDIVIAFRRANDHLLNVAETLQG
ncbi:MAG: Na/Pi cotransporter family protein [Kiritimatiellae bacterium]|nr:Na/Pi cotransporter family protein [Kiritimatiellia bacterium]